MKYFGSERLSESAAYHKMIFRFESAQADFRPSRPAPCQEDLPQGQVAPHLLFPVSGE